MSVREPLFSTNIGIEGPTYSLEDPASAQEGTPIPVTPAPVIVPTPSTTVTVAPAAPAPVPTPRRAATVLPVPVVEIFPRFNADDYAAAAGALMPRGRAWAMESGGAQSRLMLAIGTVLARIDAAASALLVGTIPGALSEMLPEWEAALGLPDPCIGDAPTIAQRLSQVRGRFAGLGGQSRQHYIDFAASLGFAITVTVYKPGLSNLPSIGLDSASPAWLFVWGVTVRSNDGALPVDVLMCELAALKPAETTLLLLDGSLATIY